MFNRLFGFCLLFLITTFQIGQAQSVSYDDVALIINDNSPSSVAIGNYFATARSIPPANIIHVSTDTHEIIDTTTFRSLQLQIESGLIGSGVLDSIQYLVTTKGMPLRISIDSTCEKPYEPGQNIGNCSSVESELSLLFSPEDSLILHPGLKVNPYLGAAQHFDRDSFDMFLVSRLDGYTVSGIEEMIDRSGPETEFFLPDSKVLLDYAGYDLGTSNVFKARHAGIVDSLFGSGILVLHDTNEVSVVPDQEGLIAFSAIYNDSISYTTDHGWRPGAIAHLMHGQSAHTFTDSLNTASGDILADLLADGASGGAGYVKTTFLGPSLAPYLFIPYYLDTVPEQRYNLAESFYMSIIGLSYHGLLIGDPKTSVRATSLNLPENDAEEWIKLFPNPAVEQVWLSWNSLNAGSLEIRIFDLRGKVLLEDRVQSLKGPGIHVLDIQHFAPGLYLVQMDNGKETMLERLVKR